MTANVDASDASSSSSSCARSRMRLGSTSSTIASSGRRSVSRCFAVGEPGQPRLHAVEELTVGEALPLLAPPRLLRQQARRRAPAPRRWGAARGSGRCTPRRRRAWSAGRRPRTPTGGRPRRPTGRCARGGRRSTGTRRRSSPAPRPRRAPPPGTRAGSRRRRAGRRARRGRPGRRASPRPARPSSTCGPSRCTSARTGATTTWGGVPAPLEAPRSRHITRRRRPIVSNDGDTRSNGRVSHAGNSSTSSSPRNWPRSRTRCSASVPVGTARSSGRRLVTPASDATNSDAGGVGDGDRGLAGDHRAQRRLLGEERGEGGEGRRGEGHEARQEPDATVHPGVTIVRVGSPGSAGAGSAGAGSAGIGAVHRDVDAVG